MMPNTQHLSAYVLAALCVLAPALATAQTYPSRPVTLISPYPPGGPTSDTGRVLAQSLQGRLGQPVIVENVGGAGGNIGVSRVIRAEPDGHTLLIHNLAIASSLALFPNLSFNPERDLAGISLINTMPLVIVGRKSLPANNLAELIAWMKAAPVIRFAQAGTGNMAHLCGALFAQTIGVKVDFIPYRGGAPALQDLIGEHVDVYCSVAPAAAPAIQAGTIKAFGVSSKERYALLPDVLTLPQSGMPNLEIEYWHGLWAPAATPKPVIERLNAAVRDVLADPQVVKLWGDGGVLVYPKAGQTPEATTAFLRSETKRWSDVIRDNHIQAGQ